MPEIMMRIKRLSLGDQQRVIVEAAARGGLYDDEEVTWTVPAKDAKTMYIGQQVRVTIDAKTDTPVEAPTPEPVTPPPGVLPSVLHVYNVWLTPDGNIDLHGRSMDAVRSGWPELGKALDALLEELVD
jgi:hypothetical protein